MVEAPVLTRTWLLIGLVLAAVFVGIVAAALSLPSPGAQAAPLTQSTISPGLFAGSVAPGEPIALGAFDLVITLNESNGTLTGGVDTELTQVFSGTATLSGQISGADADGNPTFTLSSNRFSSTISGREVARSFRLSGSIRDGGTTLQGQYTESIEGFTPEPITVNGEFLLVQSFERQRPGGPVPPPPPPPGSDNVYLPVVRR